MAANFQSLTTRKHIDLLKDSMKGDIVRISPGKEVRSVNFQNWLFEERFLTQKTYNIVQLFFGNTEEFFFSPYK